MTIDHQNHAQSGLFCLPGHPPQMYSRPLKLLGEKLDSQKTGQGNAVRLDTCLLPLPAPPYFNGIKPFWRDILKEIGGYSMDLSGSLKAFLASYYPLNDMVDTSHYTSDGQLFLAFLIADQLVHDEQNLFSPVKK